MADKKTKAEKFPPMKTRCGGRHTVGDKAKKKAAKKSTDKKVKTDVD